jgi:hypothetical protein
MTARGWPGAGASTAIVAWSATLPPRERPIRFRWESDAPAVVQHRGGTVAAMPRGRMAITEFDLPAGPSATVAVVAEVDHRPVHLRLRWRGQGDKDWRSLDDGMPGGPMWTEAVHPTAQTDDLRAVLTAALARPWDPSALEEGAMAASALGRQAEAEILAKRLSVLPDVDPTRLASLAAVIGPWPGSAAILRDPTVPPLIAVQAAARAGSAKDALDALFASRGMPDRRRHETWIDAVTLGLRLSLEPGAGDAGWLEDEAEDTARRNPGMLAERLMQLLAARRPLGPAAGLQAWLAEQEPDFPDRIARTVEPELATAIRRGGDPATIDALGGTARGVPGTWPGILARVRAQVDAGRLDDAVRTLKQLKESHLQDPPEREDDLHGALLIQALRRWGDQMPSRGPERRLLDGAQLTPAMALALEVIDHRLDPAAAAAAIHSGTAAAAALPAAIIAWKDGRMALAAQMLDVATEPTADPGIGARNLRRHVVARNSSRGSGF